MSGDPEEYSDDEVYELYRELSEAFGAYGGDAASANISVTARVEWQGEYANNGAGGMRTINFDRPVNLTAVRAAMEKAQRLEGLHARGSLSSYKARGWQAQLKQLTGTKRGRDALAAAGWNPSRETLRRYGHGTQAPSKANRARIADAYDSARNPGRGWQEAQREAADALSAVLKNTFNSDIRFRDIADFDIH